MQAAKKQRTVFRSFGACFAILCLATANLAFEAESAKGFEERVQEIMSRPAYRNVIFGIEIYSLDDGKPIYSFNADKLFIPASTTKVLFQGAGLKLLGSDYRFHTRVFRTGPIDANGVLSGDLVLVASGDPNLSNRIQPDDTLAFTNDDHTSPSLTAGIPGDPLVIIRELAHQVAAQGVRTVKGRVLVDVSFFPEGEREIGTGLTLSPVVINDNLIDLVLQPGKSQGAPASLQPSMETSYIRFVNELKTGPSGTYPSLHWDDVRHPDGSRIVTVTGTTPADRATVYYPYPLQEPSRFAQAVLMEALQRERVKVSSGSTGNEPDFVSLSKSYTPENQVAEHISPPLSEDVKVTLKISHNVHAGLTPFILGAVLRHEHSDAKNAGFRLEQEFLSHAELDLSGASQADAYGGDAADCFTPDFMVHFLAYMAKQKEYSAFRSALPIMGRDGTLADIQVKSPAAGHVYAKTGTYDSFDLLNRRSLIHAKGLVGYIEARNGEHFAFALFANHVPQIEGSNIGEAFGEIATAAYERSTESH